MSSTRSEANEPALYDISYHIDLVRSFVGLMSFSEFCADLKTIYASVRCLEIISEASRRLSPAIKGRNSQINWKRVAGAGNVYRHDYEDVEAQQVWQTVVEALPPLKIAVEKEIAKLA